VVIIMLKTRIIPILLLKGSSVVKTINFENSRVVGDAVTNVKVFSTRMADEMVIVDIEANQFGRINFPLIKRLASQCVMPITIGGGVSSLEDAEQLFRSGADKVLINSHFYINPLLLSQIAKIYGNQSVVFSLDVKRINGNYIAVKNSGTELTEYSAIDAAVLAVEKGAGEIILNSIDNDGLMKGYDLELISSIASSVNVPVVAAGGCGSKEDCVLAIKSGASAVSAGSVFHWVGESIISLKEFMQSKGIEVRLL